MTAITMTVASLILVTAAAASAGNVRDCKRDYELVERSVDITRRALDPSDLKLGSMIASSARFEFARGDTIDDFRDLSDGRGNSTLTGVPAARAFFNRINPKSFVVRKGIGPYCAVEAKTAVIEFISADGRESVDTTFTFEGSQLQRVRGHANLHEQGSLKGTDR